MALLVAEWNEWGAPENSRFLLLSLASLPMILAVPRNGAVHLGTSPRKKGIWEMLTRSLIDQKRKA